MADTTPKHIETTSMALYSDSSLAQDPDWLRNLRTSAMTRFGEIGFPSRKDEEWRSTPIAPIVETPFTIGLKADADCDLLKRIEIDGAVLVVVVNGSYSQEQSIVNDLPAGVTVCSLASAIKANNPLVEAHLGKYAKFDYHAFTALNTASITDGVFIHIAKGVVFERPIHVVYLSQTQGEASVSHPRTLVIAEQNSQVTIIERSLGSEGEVYFNNQLSEFVVERDAIVDQYKVQLESKKAFHVANMQAHLATKCNFSSQSFGFGASLVRSDAGAALLGEYCTATLNGLFLASDHQLMDSHTVLDHAVANCPSHQIYKHILSDHARAVFNGKIFVRLDAQKTDAKQTNQTILLSPDAQIDTKPQLEIFADDVRCTHGATVGQLREDQMFYLQARGIGREQARELLVYAFASDIIQRIKVPALRDELDQILLSERHIDGLG